MGKVARHALQERAPDFRKGSLSTKAFMAVMKLV